MRMRFALRSWGLLHSVGASLTLAGAAAVFAVLIMPTAAFGGPGCGVSAMSIFNFDPPAAKAGSNTIVTVNGSHLFEANKVFVGPKGNQTQASSFHVSGSSITFEVPAGASNGPIALASSSCQVFTKKSLRVA